MKLTGSKVMTGTQGAIFATSSVLGPVLGLNITQEPRRAHADELQVALLQSEQLGDGSSILTYPSVSLS